MVSNQDSLPFIFPPTRCQPVTSDVSLGSTLGPKRSNGEDSWAISIRNEMDHAISSFGKPQNEDVIRLHKRLIKLIVAVLQPNSSKQTWCDLVNALKLVEPYAKFFNISHGQALQTKHYIERLHHAYLKDVEDFAEVPLFDSLRRVFPTEFEFAETRSLKLSTLNSFWKERSFDEHTRQLGKRSVTRKSPGLEKKVYSTVLHDDNDSNVFYKKGHTKSLKLNCRQLTIGDLRQSFSAVAAESAANESMWKGDQSRNLGALAVDIHPNDFSHLSAAESASRFHLTWHEESVLNLKLPIQKQASKAPFECITGREAVEIFTMKKHLNHVQFMYFNIAESRYFRPYDLLSVPEDKVNPEHYVFSTFGVLHIFPDGSTSEIMTLAEWNRMAVLWTIISSIGFFKNFLLCKTLKRWKKVIRRQRLMRIRLFLQNNLILAVPQFGLALINIIHLVQELTKFRMLPTEQHGIKEYPLAAFSAIISKKAQESNQMLALFFRLCNRIVENTRKECFEQLKHFEHQMQHQNPLFSRESLSIQRKKNSVNLLNWGKAKQTVRQLSTFMSLVDRIISVHLLELARLSTRGFIHGVLCSKESEVDEDTTLQGLPTAPPVKSKVHLSTHSTKMSSHGNSTSKSSDDAELGSSVLVTKLVFNSVTCFLEMQPSPEKFNETICFCINNMISALSDKSNTMKKTSQLRGSNAMSDGPLENDSAGSGYPDSSSLLGIARQTDDGEIEMQGNGTEFNLTFNDRDVLHKTRFETEGDETDRATPTIVKPPELGRFGLTVMGEGIMHEFDRSQESDLKAKLSTDNEIVQGRKAINKIVASALAEVKIFWEEHNQWLVPIKTFTSSWSADSLKELKGKPARQLESILLQTKSWSDQVKNMDPFLISSNHLLRADCHEPQSEIVATLSSIFKQLISMITTEARNLSSDMIAKAKDAVKLLQNKDVSIESFAAYARKVAECHRLKIEISNNVQYIRELYEVVRMTHRQLSHGEEKSEEKVKTAWEAFVFQLKDADNFVSNQQPLILKQLSEIFLEKFTYIIDLYRMTSSGAMIDPSQAPSEVIIELRNLILKFSATKRQLTELSMCRDSIEGKTYKLEELPDMAKVMESRLELWKYVNLSSQTISEWNGILFRRFNVQFAIDKVKDWQKVCLKLREILTENDPVLLNWSERLSNFSMDLPMLQMMSNPAVKLRHWRIIFTGLGQAFDPGWNFTVKDILSFNLSEHAHFINQVCHGAVAEFTLEQTLRVIKEKWEHKQFQLAKHIQMVQTKVEQHAAKPRNEAKHGLRNVRDRIAKTYASKVAQVVLQEIDSDTYVIAAYNELLQELSDSHTTLQSMLQSRHAAEIRFEAEIWSDAFQRVSEIVQLWGSCQDKWMYLHMVYSNDSALAMCYPEQILLFENMDKKYREFVRAVLIDPKVLSVLSRRHGQKGWRELQGDNLRKHILSCIQMQEELLATLSHLIDEFRSSFPRMYFLCDEECVKLLAISRQPKAFAPYVKKLFKGIKSLTYKMPPSEFAGITTENNLNHELHSHRLMVTQIQGKNGEYITFDAPLVMQSDAIRWLKLFEKKMSLSLKHYLNDLLHHRQNGIQWMLHEVLQFSSEVKPKKDLPWLLRYPTQIILLSESVLWTRDAEEVLKSREFGRFDRAISENILQCSHVVQNCGITSKNQEYKRIVHTFSTMIVQLIYQRDVTRQLQKCCVSSVDSFEWQKIIKHSIDIPAEFFNFWLNLKSTQLPDCIVEHLGIPIDKYGMEYSSSSVDSRQAEMPFAMTSVSERNAFSLCVALQEGKCGTLIGPESAGKSALIRQMARIFGRPLINLNCTAELSTSILTRALCGVVESPYWLCLDCVQLLPKNTLSVLSQHIHHIQLAYSVLYSSAKSQYTVRGNLTKEPRLQRSNSIPSLHSNIAEVTNTKEWIPAVNESFLLLLSRNKDDLVLTGAGKSCQIPENIGNITFAGKLLQPKYRCGLFMTLSNDKRFSPDVPENTRLVYRPIVFIKPDIKEIAEVWLVSYGFLNSTILARKIKLAMSAVERIGDSLKISSMPEDEISKNIYASLADLRSIIGIASADYLSNVHGRQNLEDDGSVLHDTHAKKTKPDASEALMNLHIEEKCLSCAMSNVLMGKFINNYAKEKLKESLGTFFSTRHPDSKHFDDEYIKQTEAINLQLQIDGHLSSPTIVEKIMELESALHRSQATVLVGPAGCGKTTIYRTLAGVINLRAMGQRNLSDNVKDKTPFTPEQSDTKVQDHEKASWASSNKGVGKTVDVNVIYPNAISIKDLFGYFASSSQSGLWIPGFMSKVLHCFSGDGKLSGTPLNQDLGSADSKHSRLNKWIILDGEITGSLIEYVNSLLDVDCSARLQNLDEMILEDQMNVIFEVTDLNMASPCLLSRCRIINCADANHWSYKLSSWLSSSYRKYSVTQDLILVWKDLISVLLPKTLDFLDHIGRNVMNYQISHEQMLQLTPSSGSYEVSSFLELLSALLNMHLNRDTQSRSAGREKERTIADSRPEFAQTPISDVSTASRLTRNRSQSDEDFLDFNYQLAMNLFGFAFVWSFGGRLLEQDMPRFDAFFRSVMNDTGQKIHFPIYENVFEYYVDVETGDFAVWEDKIDLRPNASTQEAHYSYIHQIDRYAYLSSILLESQYPVLVLGERGCGKSSMVSNLLQQEHEIVRVPISAGMTPWHLQKLIESHSSRHLKQHNIGLMAHPNAVIDTRSDVKHKVLFFLDDLSCASNARHSDSVGSAVQPVHELVRQILCSNSIYDKEHQIMKTLEGNMNFLAASSISSSAGSGLGHSVHLMSPRLSRKFFAIHFLKPSKDAILSMYHNVVQSWLEEFPAYSLTRHYELSQAIIAGAVELFSAVQNHFKPTPRQPTYVFSLHDISHIMQGLFLLKPKVKGRAKMARRKLRMVVARDDGPTGPRQRPLAGRAGGRFKTKQFGDATAGALPMMRTVIRMWLHECCRTFSDRLINEVDRDWFSKSLVELLKRHFCTAPNISSTDNPRMDDIRISDAPTPSGISVSGYSQEALSSASPVTEDSAATPQVFTPQTPTSQQNENSCSPSEKNIGSSLGNSSHDQMDSRHSMRHESEVQSVVASETSIVSSPDVDDKRSPSIEEVAESLVLDGEISEINAELQSTSQESSDETSRNLDEEGDSRRTMSLDLRTEIENQSVVTAATTAEQETDSSTSAMKTDDQLTVAETESSKSGPSIQRLPRSTQSFADDSGDQPSSSPQCIPRRPMNARPGGAKFGVTFMPGLIDGQADGTVNAGPLVSLDQILSENENPRSIVFGMNILSYEMGGTEDLCESTSEQLSSALNAAQNEYNEIQPNRLDLVFFQQAIQHIVRLSRSISLSQCGHALCLSSTSFAGRKSLCRLAAFMCKATFIHPPSEEKEAANIKERFREYIIKASKSAAVLNTNTVLLLDGAFANMQCLQDLCSLIKEGHYPSLYTHEDLATLADEISSDAGLVSVNPAHHFGSTAEKLDLCLELFFKRVVSNLHIVLLLKYPAVNDQGNLSPLMYTTSSPYFHHLKQLEFLHQVFKSCPEFLTRFACIDFYESWDHIAWMKAAKSFLKSFSGDVPKVPWSLGAMFDIEMSNVCHMMSYIHQDVQNQLKVTVPESAERLVSPITFRTMVNLFVNIAVKVGKNERTLLERYDMVLRKIAEAEAEVERYIQGKNKLIPLLQEATEDERSWKRHVEHERREYTEAKERCNLEEEIIETLEVELDSYKQEAKLAFNKVNPLYNAAVQTMQALTVQDLNELKRYKKPPESAVVVVKALCDLFDVKPANWENGKALLMRDNFYEDLEFFDKDNIPESIYQSLSKHVKDPDFQPELVARGSKTAEALCLWMHAIHSYAKMSRYLAPKIARLKAAEAKMKKAQLTLGVKRVRCNQIKDELDMKIQKHKDACDLVKQCEEDLKTLKAKMTKAQILMGNLAEYINAWRLRHYSITSRLNSALGDSLLAAACSAYYGILNQKQRDSSLERWMEICFHGYVNESSGMLEYRQRRNKLSAEPRMSLNGQKNDTLDMTKTDDGILQQDEKLPFLSIQKDFDPMHFIKRHTMHKEWKKSYFSKNQQIQAIATTVLFANSIYQECSWPLIFDPDDELRQSIKDIVEVHFQQNSSKVDDDEGELFSKHTNSLLETVGKNDSEEAKNTVSKVSTIPVQSTQYEKSSNAHSLSTEEDDVKVVVVDADSPVLSKNLEKCIHAGLVMIVTHLERAQLPTLQHLLRQKQWHRKESANFDYRDSVHKNFRLFLCTSVSMKFVDAIPSLNLPLESCCCIDFSLDTIGIEEKLVHVVMSHERPDLDSHIRLMETDIAHLEQQREKLHSDLITKVSSITDCILSDPWLLDAVRSCTRETLATDSALSETNMMKFNFLRKLVEVRDVMKSGTAIHEAVLQTSMLRKDFYYWTGSNLLSIFTHIMKEKMKKRKPSNTHPPGLSLKSRAAELSQSLMEAVLHSVKYTMFSNDYLLLTSVLSLMSLVHQSKFSVGEMKSFLVFISDKTRSLPAKSKSTRVVKPIWMADHIWEAVKELEENHTAFKGLSESLYVKQNLWHEYLNSPPALLANVPSDHLQHLNIGQKALLWKTARPDMIMEIMLELSCGVLGQISSESRDCNVMSILEQVGKNDSVVFFTSSQGVVRHPAPEIRLEAKNRNIELIEKTAPFDSNLASVFRIAMKDGHWLLLHECDLERIWPNELVSVIHQLCDWKDSLTKENTSAGFGDEATTQSGTGTKSDDSGLDLDCSTKKGESLSIEEIKTESHSIHEDFRLWIIMKPNGSFLPEILLRKAFFVNLTSPIDQSSLMKRCCHLIALLDCVPVCEPKSSSSDIDEPAESRSNVLFKTSLSFMHSLFPDSDIIDNYKLCQFLIDHLQVKGVLNLCKALLSWTEYFGTSLDGWMDNTLHSDESSASQQKYLDWLQPSFTKMSDKVNSSIYGKHLWDEKDAMHILIEETARRSSNFLTGAKRHLETNGCPLLKIEAGFQKTLRDITIKLENLILPMLDKKVSERKGPLADYFYSEYIRASTLIRLLRRDFQNCLAAVKGETEINPVVLSIINALLLHSLPQHWVKEHRDIFRFITHTQIHGLISKLQLFINYFPGYADSVLDTFNGNLFQFQNDPVRPSSVMQTPIHYNLAVLLRPDLFLDAVLVHTAQTSFFADPVSFEVEIFQRFTNSITPGATLSCSIIIDGISLHNAAYDFKNHILKESSSNSFCQLPAVRLTPTMARNKSPVEKSRMLYCPLHCEGPTDGVVLVHIPLRCKDSSFLHTRGVYALTCFPNDAHG